MAKNLDIKEMSDVSLFGITSQKSIKINELHTAKSFLNSRQLALFIDLCKFDFAIPLDNNYGKIISDKLNSMPERTELYKICKRLMSSKTWSLTVDSISMQWNGLPEYVTYKAGCIENSSDFQAPAPIKFKENTVISIDADKYPHLYNTTGVLAPAQIASQIGIPADYKFIPHFILLRAHAWYTLLRSKTEDAKIKVQSDIEGYKHHDLWLLKSSNAIDALSIMPRSALKNPERAKIGFTNSTNIIIKTKDDKTSLIFKEEQFDLAAIRSPNTDKLLKICNFISMNSGYQSNQVKITLDEFMGMLGLHDRKNATAKLKTAINAIDSIIVKAEDAVTKRTATRKITQGSDFVPGKGRASSYVLIRFTDDYLQMLKNTAQIAQFPKKILMIPDNKMSAYKIANTFYLHKRRNAGKNGNRENTLRVTTLLEHTDLITIEELNEKKMSKNAGCDIVENFIRALETLEDNKIFSFEFAHPTVNGTTQQLTAEELERLYGGDYELFSSLVVTVRWFDEPDYNSIKPKTIRKRGRPPKEK